MMDVKAPPLEEVEEKVREDDIGKWDLLIDREELRMRDGRLQFSKLHLPLSHSSPTLSLSSSPLPLLPKPYSLTPNRWSTSQMCQRLGIPTGYFRKCPVSLQDEQANYWLGNSSERWLLRAKENTLRGVLSDKYARLNNTEVFCSLLPVIEERFQVGWYVVDEESFHLRLIDPTMRREAVKEDDLFAGLHVANSEVGKRAVTVDAMVFRLVCQNGLVRLVKGKSLFYQKHIYLDSADFTSALQKAVQEAVLQSAGFMERMIWSMNEAIPDMDEAIEKLSSRWGLSQEFQANMLTSLRRERSNVQETLYGLVNAVTNAAQSLPPDDRYDLEALAGKLLEEGVPQGGKVVSKRRLTSLVEASPPEDRLSAPLPSVPEHDYNLVLF